MAWLFLTFAILAEVTGTSALRMATHGNRAWYGLVVGAYLLAFSGLSLALAGGMALGVAYGIWAAAGVALTAVISKVLFGEPLTWLMTSGIALIIGGVLLIETSASH